eukprot:3046569-Rhodomonas_salina.1
MSCASLLFQFGWRSLEGNCSNYDLYLKYTNMIESQLEAFLKQHDVDHEDVAKLCVAGARPLLALNASQRPKPLRLSMKYVPGD